VDRQAFIAGDGTFEFRDVAPGFYRVELIPAMSAAAADVIVRDRDVDVNIGRPWIRVSGAVTVEGGGPVPPFELEFASLTASGDRDRLGRVFVVQAGPRFTVDMPVGRYRITATGLPQSFRFAAPAQPFEVSAAARAELALVLGIAGPAPWVKVAGRIDGGSSGTKPAKVTLSGPGAATPIVAAVKADGSFEFTKILPGKYEALVVPSGLTTARSLTVGSGGVSDFRIVLPALKDMIGEFVRIDPGTFVMGCAARETQPCNDTEKPAHRVGVTRGFELGRYEVTQAQWEAVMGTNPSALKGPTRPVDNVTWQDAQEFIARLNAGNDGYRYRLPTEAEWEYAARAGSAGPEADPLASEPFGWFNTNSEGATHPVGQKLPNAWGLFDMQGNVSEWVADWYDDFYYANSPELDPTGPRTGQQHVLRGGHFGFHPNTSRITSRLGNPGNSASGFRLVRESAR
jgi:formylglycine-generating enzyme required for sulfatase activity